MRILLIQPAGCLPAWPTRPRAVEPMGLLYVAGAFRDAGADVEIIDMALGFGDLEKAFLKLSSGYYDMVGIALASQAVLWNGLAMAWDIKNTAPGTPIFTGGVFATLNAQWLLEATPAIDCVVLGEGEAFAQQIVLEKGNYRKIDSACYRDKPAMDQAPFFAPFSSGCNVRPDRRLLPRVLARGETPSIVATRGCGGGCSFCCISKYSGSRWRGRNALDVVQELKELYERFGTLQFHLIDDNLFGHTPSARDWIRQFLSALESTDLQFSFKTTCRLDDLDTDLIPDIKRAGFKLLKIGVETFSQATQKKYSKRIKRSEASSILKILEQKEIDVSLGLIMFDPWCTVDDLHENMAFLDEQPKIWGRHLLRSELKAYRGTRVENLIEKEGLSMNRTIMGTQWQFRSSRTKAVFKKFDQFLKSNVLGIEWKIYNVQKAALSKNLKPEVPASFLEMLKLSWIKLFKDALTGESVSDKTMNYLQLLNNETDRYVKKSEVIE